MTSLEQALRACPPNTRVGAFLRRHDRTVHRQRIHDWMKIELMCAEIGRMVDEDARQMPAEEAA